MCARSHSPPIRSLMVSALPGQVVDDLKRPLPARERGVELIPDAKLRRIEHQDVRSSGADTGDGIRALIRGDWIQVAA